MMNILFKLIKVSSLVLLVLVLGHIPVDSKSISDHIGSVIKGPFVQTKLTWLSSKVDFTNGYKGVQKKGLEKNTPSKTSSVSHSDNPKDKGFLSGIFKLN